MTEDEIQAIVLNPGRDGVYWFFKSEDKYSYYRKYANNTWHSGKNNRYSSHQHECCQAAAKVSAPSNGEYVQRDLREGYTMTLMCNADGSPLVPVRKEEQLELF